MSVRILIVEDVDEMREWLATLLEGIEGIRVSAKVRNGWEAREELMRRRPDLVLLDEILPGESSRDLLDELKSEGIPTVLMTGVSEPTHAIPVGAASRIVKPDWREAESGRDRLREAIWAALALGPALSGGKS